MLANRDPNDRAAIFSIQRGCSSYLAGIAHRVFMRRCVPVEGAPFCLCFGRCVLHGKDGDVFRIQGVAHASAVAFPEMVVVNLDGLARIEISRGDLAVDRNFFGTHRWIAAPRCKESRRVCAVLPTDHECRGELDEKRLLRFIGQAVVIRIDGVGCGGTFGNCRRRKRPCLNSGEA